ncbi:hypothetical protein D3C81_1946800 [compost metagenome]
MQLLGRDILKRYARDQNFTSPQRIFMKELLKQGRLPAAGSSNNAECFPWMKIKIDLLQIIRG